MPGAMKDYAEGYLYCMLFTLCIVSFNKPPTATFERLFPGPCSRRVMGPSWFPEGSFCVIDTGFGEESDDS